MNILVFSWRDPKHPLAGGAEQVMHEHMKGWVAAGHDVTLFSSLFNGSLNEEELDGIRIIRRGYQHHLSVQFAGFLYYQKHNDQYDFIVDQFHGMPFFTPLYVQKPKLAIIQEIAQKVWFLNPFPWPINWIYGSVGYILEPLVFLLYKNTLFMTGSNSAKEDVSKFGIPKNAITIISHGVILDKPKYLPPKEKVKTISYLGILSKDKGIEDALRCFSLLKAERKCQFWVIGKPETQEYFTHIKKLVNELHMENDIKFWGFVDQKTKFDLLTRSHILINPSVHEGWGLVNIEANAVGTPVVAYKSKGLVDSVKDGISGIITNNNTPEDLAKAVQIIIRDKKRYKIFCKDSVQWSRLFSWDKSRKLSLQLIEKISTGYRLKMQ